MSFETDRILKKIQNYIEKHGDAYSSPDLAVQDAIKKFNEGNLFGNELADGFKDDKDKALDLLEKAQYISDIEERKKVLAEAYKLNQFDLDITMEYVLSHQPYHKAFETLSQVEREYLKNNRRTIREGYVVLENRPYFRLKYLLIKYYFEQKLYNKAIEQAKESIKLNSNDNLGVRYVLMAIYVLISDFKSAHRLYKSNENNKYDDQLILCMLTAAVLEGRINDGQSLSKQLYEINKNITEFFIDEEFDMNQVITNLPEDDYFQLNSKESLAITFSQLIDFYAESDYLYQIVKGFFNELDPHYFEITARNLASPFNAIQLAGHGIFTNIKIQYVQELLRAGFETLEDFKTVSKKDILDLPMIGKMTVRRLEENGVKFKDS